MAEKPRGYGDRVEVVYSTEHWSLFKSLRDKAKAVMEALQKSGVQPLIHGSVCRGDADHGSDVDIIVPYAVPSQKVELALIMHGLNIYSREITQATPSHSLKGHIYLNAEENLSVTLPLIPFRSLEIDFYRFGGLLDFDSLKKDRRVPGCTKRLTLIEPTSRGHFESPILGRDAEIAKILGVSVDIIRERVRVLTRRDEVGRTGIFLSVSLSKDESFEGTLKKIIDSNPAVRRTYLRRLGH